MYLLLLQSVNIKDPTIYLAKWISTKKAAPKKAADLLVMI